MPTEHDERALYVLDGVVRVDGTPLPPGPMLVLPTGTQPLIEATTAAQVHNNFARAQIGRRCWIAARQAHVGLRWDGSQFFGRITERLSNRTDA